MKLTIITPDGVVYDDDAEHIVVSTKTYGDFGMLDNHAPIVSTIDAGYVKIEQDGKAVFCVVINGVLEQQDNRVNIIAQEAETGMSKDEATQHLDAVRQERLEENRRRTVDFLRAEQQLKKSIREAKASKRS